MADIGEHRLSSAVSWRTSLVGVWGFAVGLLLAFLLRVWPALALIALVACTAIPMWWAEGRALKMKGIAFCEKKPEVCGVRWRARLLGLVGAGALWALTLNFLSLADASVLNGFWEFISVAWPFVACLGAGYILVPVKGEVSGLEKVGVWLQRVDAKFPAAVFRDQLVKAFFLPLMIAFAYGWIVRFNSGGLFGGGLRWYIAAIALLYLIDTIFGVVGYISTFRRLDSHIRSSNPYWSAWVAALVCYPPIFIWLEGVGFSYRESSWQHWFSSCPSIFHVWSGLIVLLTMIYAISTIVFGVRFSNLTNRGIVTHGPYRWTKHPAYISKNLSWWMISVPFLSSSGLGVAVWHCAVLLVINAIYWFRAKTEERHLMADPAYREYVAWIARYGFWARVKRLVGGRAR